MCVSRKDLIAFNGNYYLLCVCGHPRCRAFEMASVIGPFALNCLVLE
jgi:hypothetical protein